MVDLALVPLFLCVRTKLLIELFPREAQRALERKRPIDEPEVQVEAEWRPLERLEAVQVERDRVRDDLVGKILPRAGSCCSTTRARPAGARSTSVWRQPNVDHVGS